MDLRQQIISRLNQLKDHPWHGTNCPQCSRVIEDILELVGATFLDIARSLKELDSRWADLEAWCRGRPYGAGMGDMVLHCRKELKACVEDIENHFCGEDGHGVER